MVAGGGGLRSQKVLWLPKLSFKLRLAWPCNPMFHPNPLATQCFSPDSNTRDCALQSCTVETKSCRGRDLINKKLHRV